MFIEGLPAHPREQDPYASLDQTKEYSSDEDTRKNVLFRNYEASQMMSHRNYVVLHPANVSSEGPGQSKDSSSPYGRPLHWLHTMAYWDFDATNRLQSGKEPQDPYHKINWLQYETSRSVGARRIQDSPLRTAQRSYPSSSFYHPSAQPSASTMNCVLFVVPNNLWCVATLWLNEFGSFLEKPRVLFSILSIAVAIMGSMYQVVVKMPRVHIPVWLAGSQRSCKSFTTKEKIALSEYQCGEREEPK